MDWIEAVKGDKLDRSKEWPDKNKNRINLSNYLTVPTSIQGRKHTFCRWLPTLASYLQYVFFKVYMSFLRISSDHYHTF
ncbi:hypothetical protein DPMN_006497 [Dreissena polymorpha]|uniref:Uncharacterized protein n=1 Tax=Dreissena polymorpha TaxID=45954 RepID=A0A9D4RXF9_DREPO|nr:hypothetical protein DPMN_006497 [Dreissena polymorpha]